MRKFQRCLLILGASIWLAACGGGGGGGGGQSSTSNAGGSTSTPSSSSSGGGNTTVTANAPAVTGDNVQPISVNAGIAGTTNLAFASVTVCVPGTGQCQTIDNVLIDTGSSGLRVLASALNSLALPQQTTVANHPLAECIQFVDLSHIWGSIKQADVKIAGKIAHSAPIQVIGDSAIGTDPSTCANGSSSTSMNTVAKLGGNGILGVGSFVQDCGDYCATTVANNIYYDCPGTTCTQTLATLASQVHNPIALFDSDNNGVVIDLPAVADTGATRANGWMVFGIGTRDNNALGTASTYTLNSVGNLTAQYKNSTYAKSFIDSGSNGLFFPDTSIPKCSNAVGFYCPNILQHLTATIVGNNNTSNSISFSVANAELLNGNFAAFNDLGGFLTSGFDFGLPFFYGRKIYTALESNPQGAYVAF